VYIFTLLLYMLNKKYLFTNKWQVRNHDARSANNFIYPLVIRPNTLFRNKHFNNFPTHIKSVANEIQVFKSALKSFLLSNSFYSTQKYFNSNTCVPYCFVLMLSLLYYYVIIIIVFWNMTLLISEIQCVIIFDYFDICRYYL
jgi:hypothetical protein